MKTTTQSWGIQSELARKSGITRSTIASIFSGKRRATPEQAELLAPLLALKGINIDRWAMVSCPRGTKLMDLAC